VRICVLAVALAALALAACAEDEGGGGGDPSEPAEQAASAPTPIGCLKEVLRSYPEKRGFGTWIAIVPGTEALIIVERMPSRAFARQAELKATEVAAESVGRYFIHGPVLDADDGSTAAVAACLGGS
jgi:hypothetical protein